MAKRRDSDDVPPLDKYHSWLRVQFPKVPGVVEGQAYYDTVAESLKIQFEKTAFWLDLQTRLNDYEAAYQVAANVGLMAFPHPGFVASKSWDSFLRKIYRRNVLENPEFPKEPLDGWLLPPNWFLSVKDVLRTMFVVKYLDGVLELGQRIGDLATEHGLRSEFTREATPAGYYAGHVVIWVPLEIPMIDWRRTSADVPVEIQVTTQVKEAIKELLERTYQQQRMEVSDETVWQWEYEGRPFAANFLGHVLHHVEGRVMNIRRVDSEGTWE